MQGKDVKKASLGELVAATKPAAPRPRTKAIRQESPEAVRE
jgi:hypothetical protein